MPPQHAEPSQPHQRTHNQGVGQERLPSSDNASFTQAPLAQASFPNSGSGLLRPDHLLHLQRTIGNRAVQRMLGERPVAPLPLASKAPRRVLQREEDEERGPEIGPKIGVQRMANGEAAVQRKKESASIARAPKVQVHTNSHKAAAAGALAYTQGTNIYVAPGQYNPNSRAGASLLKHEEAHVAQQLAGRVQPTKQLNGMAVNREMALEREADRWAKEGIAPKGAPNGSVSSSINVSPGNASQTNVAQFKFPETIEEWIFVVTSDERFGTDAALWVERLSGMAADGEEGKLKLFVDKGEEGIVVKIVGYDGKIEEFTPQQLCIEATNGRLTPLLRGMMVPPKITLEKEAPKKQSSLKGDSKNRNQKMTRTQSPLKKEGASDTKSLGTGGVPRDKSPNKDSSSHATTKNVKELLVVGSHMSGDMYGVAAALTFRPKLSVLILSDRDPDHLRTKADMEKLFRSVKSPTQEVFVKDDLKNVNEEWQEFVGDKIWQNPENSSDLYRPIGITAETAWVRGEFAKGHDEAKEKGTENEAFSTLKERWVAPKEKGNEKDKELAIGFLKHRGIEQGKKYGLIWGKQGKDTHPHPQHYSSPGSRNMLFDDVQQSGRIPVAVGDEIKGADTKPNLTRFWADDEFPTKFKDEGRRGQLKFFHYLNEFADIVHIGMRSGILEGPALLGQKVIYLEEKDNDQAGRWEKLLDVMPTFRRVILDAPPGASEKKAWVRKVLWQRHESAFRQQVRMQVCELLGIEKEKQNQIGLILSKSTDLVSAHSALMEAREKLSASAKPTSTTQKATGEKPTAKKRSDQKASIEDESTPIEGSTTTESTISVVPTISDESSEGVESTISQSMPKEEVSKLLLAMLEGAQLDQKAMIEGRETWEEEEFKKQAAKSRNKESGEGMNSGEVTVIRQLMSAWNEPPSDKEAAQNYHRRTWHKADDLDNPHKSDWVEEYKEKRLQEEAEFAFMVASRAPSKTKGQGGEDEAQVDDLPEQEGAQTQTTVPMTSRDKIYNAVKQNERFPTLEPFKGYYATTLRKMLLDRFVAWFVPTEQRGDKKPTIELLLSWFTSEPTVGKLAYEESRVKAIGTTNKEEQDHYDLKALLEILGEGSLNDRLKALVPGLDVEVYTQAIKRSGKNLLGAYKLLSMPKQFPYLKGYRKATLSKEPLGQGKQKDVYRINGYPDRVLAKMKKNDYFSLLSGELEMLAQIESAGLTILKVIGVTTHDAMPAVVMQLYGEHSKDFVAKKRSDFSDGEIPPNYLRYESKPPTPKTPTPKTLTSKTTAPEMTSTKSTVPMLTEPQPTEPQPTEPKIIEPISMGPTLSESTVGEGDNKNLKEPAEERFIKRAKYLNKQSIIDLLDLQGRMEKAEIRIKDLQFLIAEDGHVVINDPGTVQKKTKPSVNEISVIDNLIATTVHHLIVEAGGLEKMGILTVSAELLRQFGVPLEKHIEVLSLLDSRYRLPVEKVAETKVESIREKNLKDEKKPTREAKKAEETTVTAPKVEGNVVLNEIQKRILKGLYQAKEKFIPLGSKYTAKDYEPYLGVISKTSFIKELKLLREQEMVATLDDGLHLLPKGEEKAKSL